MAEISSLSVTFRVNPIVRWAARGNSKLRLFIGRAFVKMFPTKVVTKVVKVEPASVEGWGGGKTEGSVVLALSEGNGG